MKTDIAALGFERGMRGIEKPVRDAFKAPAQAESFESRLASRLKAQAKPQPKSSSQAKPGSGPAGAEPTSPQADVAGGAAVNAAANVSVSPLQAPQAQKAEGSESTMGSAAMSMPVSRTELKAIPRGQGLATGELAGAAAGQAQVVGGKGAVDPELIAVLEAFGKEQTEVKQSAVSEFMVKMQEELGVPPEKILAAFASLDQQTMMAPPEEAMEDFIANLDLKPAQVPRAESLYLEMVDVTGEAELNRKFAGLEDGVNFEILSPRDAVTRKLQGSIEDMNEKFFARPPASAMTPVQDPMRPLTPDEMNAQIARLANEKLKNRGVTGQAAGAASGASTNAATVLNAASLANERAISAETASEMMMPEGFELESLSNDFTSQAADSEGLLNALENMAGNGSSSSFEGGMSQENGQGSSNLSEAAQKNLMGQLKNSEGPAKAKKFSAEIDAANASMKDVATSTGATGSVLAQPAMPNAPGVQTTPAAMIMTGPQPTPQDEAANVKELISKAQVMLKKGGGEMKLEMSPEGMGQVQLKVAVENGQVNVQMLTESDAAKKLLENGLHELKASLAAHKLHVERMQIDVGQEIQKHMDQKGGQDASREQARQMAQDFLGQFRQEREGFREMFSGGFGGMRGYGRTQNRAQVAPEPVVTQSSARRANAASDRRLNLVA